MRAFLAVCLLTLAACDPPLEEVFPARFYSFDRGGIVYETRAQFDPFEHGWFVRVTSIQDPLEADDLDFALALTETDLGPLICGGNALDVEPGEVWNPLAGDQVEFLDDLDSFQFVGRCTGAPPAPGVVAVRAEPDVLIVVDED
ncbi:MAG TPA: hypothetical protein VFJ13_12255 [Paracoccaceae bacterium]|nr:hypothetical protein [Paracoccaceae bacterium]